MAEVVAILSPSRKRSAAVGFLVCPGNADQLQLLPCDPCLPRVLIPAAELSQLPVSVFSFRDLFHRIAIQNVACAVASSLRLGILFYLWAVERPPCTATCCQRITSTRDWLFLRHALPPVLINQMLKAFACASH